MSRTLPRIWNAARCAERICGAAAFCAAVYLFASCSWSRAAKAQASTQTAPAETQQKDAPRYKLRARRFLAGRALASGVPSAGALDQARRQHAAMLRGTQPQAAALSTPWQPVGPNQIASLAYGNVTGRVTAIAIDPADATGNTVYIGTTGGGVWKSIDAAGPTASVQFIPLTDTLPVFNPNAGSAVVPSLSIGAVSVANRVILAGTGDPNDALDSFYGSGLLRSADAGTTWTLVQQSNDGTNGTHSFTGLGFAGFAWSTGTSTVTASTVVAAVSDAAEGELVNAASDTQSVRGLYYSTDSGVTWRMAVIEDGGTVIQTPLPSGGNHGGNAVTAVVWNPVRQRFYAAVRYHGYYESADGSVWTRLAVQPGTGLTTAACPPDPNSTGSASCPIFRGALAVEPVSGDTFAFTVDAGNLDQGIWRDACLLSNLTDSTCASGEIAFAAQLDTTPLEAGGGSTEIFQGDYDLSLAAVATGTGPGNATLLFAGTVDLFRCSLNPASSGAAGCSFRNTTNTGDGCAAPAMVAPAQHAIGVLATGAAPLLYLGNDGGLWSSNDGVNEQGQPCSADDATHFQNLNSGLGSLAEVVDFAQPPSDANTLLVGVGANGTAATSAAPTAAPWPQLTDGEGGFTAIDPSNPMNWYLSNGPGVSITFCGDGPMCDAASFAGLPTIGPAQVDEDDSLLDPPWLLDPALTSSVLIGTCRVWRGPAADGAAWGASNLLSTGLGGTQDAVCGNTNPVIRSLAAGGPASTAAGANAGSEVLYAGMAGALDGGGGDLGGHIFTTGSANTADSNTAWNDLALSPVTDDSADAGVFNPGGFDISAVAADAHDPAGKTVYATVMGFAGNSVDAPHVYGSTDGGAHWTNLTSNLPNAPANSVVVDPNDANTVYVAMDTGVYVTTQVSTCATATCWSVFGAGLPNAPVVQLAAAAEMPAGSGSLGMLRAATYGRGIWQIPLLTAAPPANAAIAMNPASLTFAAEAVGTASAARTITVTNTGNAALTIGSLGTTGDFAETDNCAGATVAAGANCSVQVTFLPTATGAGTGVLTVYGNVPGGQATAALSGTGVAPAAVELAPLSLNFGTVTEGATSPAQIVSVSNTGGVPAALQTPAISGDFQMTANTCESSLPADVSCTISMVFAPTAAGTRDGTLGIADSAGTQTVSLTGRGATQATDTLTPGSLSFAPREAGTASAAQSITLANNGDTTLTLIAAAITSGSFTVTSGCGSSLAGHATCTLQVVFAPTTAGALTGTLTVSDALRTQTVALSGTGIAPPQLAAAPLALSFPTTVPGQSSAVQTVTVSNSGGEQLTLSGVAVTGDFSETDNCSGKTLPGSASCTAQVTFNPAVSGARTGSLTVTGTGTGVSATLQATVALSGTGAAPAAIVLTPTSLAFGTVTLGSASAAQNISIANTGGSPASLQTITIAGDYSVTANTCGMSLAADNGCAIAIVFTPTVSGARAGTVSVTDSVGVQTATLSGTGASLPTDGLSPLTLSFGSQQAGAASAAQNVTLTNTGDEALTLIAASITSGSFTAANGCGVSLAGHSSCTIAVAFVPVISGPVTGTLTVSDALRTQTVALSGTGVAPPQLAAAPTALSFAGTVVGQSSAAQAVAVSNSGGGQATVTGITVTGDFAETDTCSGKALTGSTECTVQVVFSPTATGSRSGSLSITGTGGGATLQATAALSGIGLAPAAIVLTPTGLAFGTVTLGSSSAAQDIAISNTGGVPASLQTETITGDFAISANTCGTSLPAQTGCTIAVVFTPTASGTRTGTVSATDSVGVQTASLSGNGAAAATDGLAPLALAFAPQQTGTASAPQTVTLTNNGDNALTLIAARITSGDFSATNGCGNSLAGHSTCSIAVVFMPASVGQGTGVLTVSDQFRSRTVALAGTGVAPPGVSLSPAAGLTFAATGVGVASMPRTITLSNNGGESLAVSGIIASGDFSIPASNSTCGASLAPGAACSLTVVFTPTAGGARIGSLTVTDNAAGSPQVVALQGTGVDFTLAANGSASVTISSGVSAVYPLLLSSDAGTPGTATVTCTGAPTNAICTVEPGSAPLGATATISATVETGVSAAAMLDRPANRQLRGIWWAIALPLFLIPGSRARRRFAPSPMVLLAGMVCVLASGCGSGRTIPPSGGGEGGGGGSSPIITPSGTYTITVSATSAGLTRSVALTLVVQ